MLIDGTPNPTDRCWLHSAEKTKPGKSKWRSNAWAYDIWAAYNIAGRYPKGRHKIWNRERNIPWGGTTEKDIPAEANVYGEICGWADLFSELQDGSLQGSPKSQIFKAQIPTQEKAWRRTIEVEICYLLISYVDLIALSFSWIIYCEATLFQEGVAFLFDM